MATSVPYFYGRGTSTPFGLSGPPAIRDTTNGVDKTIIVPQGDNFDPYALAYDHSAGDWERDSKGRIKAVKIGDNQIANPPDAHGNSGCCGDNYGYYHNFFGAHGTALQYAISNSPNSIDGWTVQTSVGSRASYPYAFHMGSGSLVLFARQFPSGQNLGDDHLESYWTATAQSDGSAPTWSGPNVFIDFSNDSSLTSPRVYVTDFVPDTANNDIHMVFCVAEQGGNTRENVYYCILDLDTGDVRDIDGNNVGPTLTHTEARSTNNEFVVFETGLTNGVNGLCLQLDSSNNPHILYNYNYTNADSSVDAGDWDYRWKYWDNGWTDIDGGTGRTNPGRTIASGANPNAFTRVNFVLRSTSDIDFYLVENAGTFPAYFHDMRGGDLVRYNYNGTSVSKAETIIDVSADNAWFGVHYVRRVLNAASEFEIVFSESLAGADTRSVLRCGAFGSGGFVGDSFDLSADGWSRVGELAYDGASNSSDHSDVPLLVTRSELPDSLFDPSGSEAAQSDGGDLRFSGDEAGTDLLYADVRHFALDSSTGAGDGEAEIHVLGESVTAASGTSIHVWRNGSGGLTQPALSEPGGRGDVYRACYAAFGMHVDPTGSTSTYKDLSRRLRDGTAQNFGSDKRTTGRWGATDGALSLSASNSEHVKSAMYYGDFNAIGIQSGLTITAQAKPASATGNGETIAAYQDDDSTDNIVCRLTWQDNQSGDPLRAQTIDGSDANTADTVDLPIGSWSHVAARFSTNGAAVVFLNAANKVSETNTSLSGLNQLQRLSIGAWAIGTNYEQFFDGDIDEVRFYEGELSDDRIGLEHANQNDPGTFWTFSSAGGSTVDSAVITNASATLLTAVDTAIATDAANITSFAVTLLTAVDTAIATDAASITSVTVTSLTAGDTAIAPDAASITSVAVTSLTAVDAVTTTDTATITAASATPLTAVDTVVATDNAVITGIVANPLTATDVFAGPKTDAALITAIAATPLTAADKIVEAWVIQPSGAQTWVEV
jgi:hypothetical protein